MADDEGQSKEWEIIKIADSLYDNNEITQLYALLAEQKESKNAQILWRLARAARDYSQLSSTPKDLKRTLVYEGFKAAEAAVSLDDHIFACHKVFLIIYLIFHPKDSSTFNINVIKTVRSMDFNDS